jgi:hypothetical protein
MGKSNKVGKTNDKSGRQSDLLRSNSGGSMVYYKNCTNSTLAEKVVHHILDKYRTINNREWFDLDIENIKQVIDATICFLDDFVEVSEQFKEQTFSESIKKLTENFNFPEKKQYVKPIKIPKQIPESKPITIDNLSITPIGQPKEFDNYDKFIEECCILDETAFTIKKEIFGLFKLWSRSKQETLIRRFLESRFTEEKRFFEEYNSTLVGFQGISLKPYTYNKTSEKIDKFIEEYCEIGPLKRVGKKYLENKYKEYLNLEKLSSGDKIELQNYLSLNFFNINVLVENVSVDGYWGLGLLGENINTGLKISLNLKKQVYAVGIKTKEIEHIFDSAMQAAEYYKISPSAVSVSIKYQRERNGCLLCYNIDKTTDSTTKTNKKKSIIYKLNKEQFIECFDNISAAAKSIPVSRWEFVDKILDKKEHKGFIWTITEPISSKIA